MTTAPRGDLEQRRAWIEKKDKPTYARALSVSIGGVRGTAAGLEDLIARKRHAGRPKDLADVEALEAIASERGGDGDA
jgi:hypothetical protein